MAGEGGRKEIGVKEGWKEKGKTKEEVVVVYLGEVLYGNALGEMGRFILAHRHLFSSSWGMCVEGGVCGGGCVWRGVCVEGG